MIYGEQIQGPLLSLIVGDQSEIDSWIVKVVFFFFHITKRYFKIIKPVQGDLNSDSYMHTFLFYFFINDISTLRQTKEREIFSKFDTVSRRPIYSDILSLTRGLRIVLTN